MVKTRKSKKSGLPPGTLVHIGEVKSDQVRLCLTVVRYREGEVEEQELSLAELEAVAATPANTCVTWLNVEGVHHLEAIAEIGKYYDIHPLTLEDIVNTEQRPKIEEYPEYLFIVMKTLGDVGPTEPVGANQISLVLKAGLLVSFQEKAGVPFEVLRNRIRLGKGRIRTEGCDYLAYCFIDAIVDGYFDRLEKLGEEIESLQEELVKDPTRTTLQEIHRMKRDLILFRRSVWPLREAVGSILRSESALVRKTTLVYLRDVYDHLVHVIESIEIFREMLAGMMDLYLSSISNRMNEVMKVLTVIATIFMPLTFIAGVYGMNFEFMPELKWPWGYPAVLVFMLVVAICMLVYFRRKKWI